MRSTSKSQFTRVWALLLIFLIIGTVGYHFIENMKWFDSLYMTSVILSTVGFGGGLNDLSAAGRLFTMVLIIFGVGIVAFAITMISEYVVSNQLLRSQRMDKRIKKLHSHYIVCGYGRMGSTICSELTHKNTKFVVIDKNPSHTERALECGYNVIEGDCLDDKILKTAGIEKAKGLVAVLAKDENNLFVTLTARGLKNDLFIISKNNNKHNKQKFYTAGANKVLNPYEVTGHSLVNMLTRPAVMDFLELIGQGADIEWEIDEVRICNNSVLDGKPIMEAFNRSETDVIIAAIRKPDGQMVFNPRGSTILNSGDLLIAMGYLKNLKKLETLCLTGGLTD